MPHDDEGVDYSIRLEPVDDFSFSRSQKPRRRIGSRLVIAGAILLGVAAIAAFIGSVVAIVNRNGVNVTATAQRDSAAERAEAVAVFSGFDAIQQRRAQLSPELQQERDGITALCQELQTCAKANNGDGFRKLVDFDRLLKRVDLTGSLRGWSNLDKRYVRTELSTSVGIPPGWGKLVVAGTVAPADDPATRIVYAFGWNGTSGEQSEYRIWLTRAGDKWKVYDWERLDVGLSQSQQWGCYCRYHDTPAMDGYHRWTDLVGEARQAADGNHDAAKEKLRQAESQPVPPEMEDYRWVITGYYWGMLGENAESERCFANVKRPEDTPGVYFSQMNSKRATNPAEALKYAGLYEVAIGPSPEFLEAKASLLARMHRKQDAADVWKRLVRMQPDNVQALTHFYLTLPKDNKAEFSALLAELEDPAATVASLAPFVGYRDFHELQFLVDYLNREDPEASTTFFVAGFANYFDGRYPEAAALYRRAYETATDDEKRASYQNSYIEAMAAAGQVIEGLKTLPESKAVFQSLLVGHEESDVILTQDEYRQIVAMYAERFPGELDAIGRSANLAIEEHRYEEAERLLRQGLSQSAVQPSKPADKADDASGEEEFDEDESDHDTLANYLATALFKQGRLKEAYDAGEKPDQRFLQLAHQAINGDRWDDLRQLHALHEAKAPDDPQLHYVAGEIAAHEKKWDAALDHFRQALSALPENERWQLKARLPEVCIESGKWMEYYQSTEDPNETFATLARSFVDDKDWTSLNRLLIEHRSRPNHDGNLYKYEAAAAWERKQYAACAQSLEELLRSTDANVLPPYQRVAAENRRLGALIRAEDFDQARQMAQTKQQQENDVSMLAVVDAASGDFASARRLARDAAANSEDATAFYSSDNAADVFLGDEFRDLQREYPVALPFDSTTTLGVFLFDTPYELEAANVTAALDQLGIQTTAVPQPLRSTDKHVTRAFALRFHTGSVLLIAGEGRFDDGWKLSDDGNDKSPLVASINNTKSWLAISAVAWTKTGREEIEPLARRLGRQLVGDRAAVLRAHTRRVWEIVAAFPATHDTLLAWQATGNLGAFKDESVAMELKERTDKVADNREFDRTLREAIRKFETTPNSKLVVLGSLSDYPAVDLMPLDVTAVRRSYGGLEFDGTLKTRSLLIPQLKPGLPMRFPQYKIKAWRLNDEAPVYRP